VHDPITHAICAMPFRRHLRLIVEDAAEMVAVGEHLRLVRQISPARVHQVHARQPVLQRDLLRAQMLLHRHRIVSAAFDRGVVAHDHRLAARHPPDPGDHPAPGHLAVIQVARRQLPDLQQGRSRVEQPLHPFARQQFAARDMPLPRLLVPPKRRRTRARSSSASPLLCAA
jgi:hypothetical protein